MTTRIGAGLKITTQGITPHAMKYPLLHHHAPLTVIFPKNEYGGEIKQGNKRFDESFFVAKWGWRFTSEKSRNGEDLSQEGTELIV